MAASSAKRRLAAILMADVEGYSRLMGRWEEQTYQAVRDALIAFMAALGQAQAEATKLAQRAGIERAKASADKPYRGRKPSFTRKQFEMARTLLAQERVNVGAIAAETGLSRQTVYRIKDDPTAAEAALGTWGL